MEIMQYFKDANTLNECLFIDTIDSYNEVSFDKLGTILLLIMKTVPLLNEKPAYKELYHSKLRAVFMESKDTQNLFDYFLWSEYKFYYSEEKDYHNPDWDNQKNRLQSIYNYVSLCTARRNNYNKKNLLLLASTIVSDFSPPASIDESLKLNMSPYIGNYSPSELDDLFQNSKKQDPKEIYYCPSLCHICLASLYELISAKKVIKKCEQCGKWFVEPTKNNNCCSEQCSAIVRREKEKKRLSGEVVNMIRIRRDTLSRECQKEENVDALSEFDEVLPKWREDIKSGTVTVEELKAWLDSYSRKNRKLKNKK